MDARSEHILHCLREAYAHQVARILTKKEGTWEYKVEHWTHYALLSTQDEEVLHEWLCCLDQLEPPAHPTEYPALMSSQYRWTKVINDNFVQHIKMLLLNEQQWII